MIKNISHLIITTLTGVLLALGCVQLLHAQAPKNFPVVVIPPESRYLRDRVILVGTEAQVNAIENAPTYTSRISLTQRSNLSFLSDVARRNVTGAQEPVFPPFTNGELSSLRMDVVRLKLQLCFPVPCTPPNTVENLIVQINADPNFRVYALPNYVAYGSEWNVGANPKWWVRGSPVLSGTTAVTASLYRDQFNQLGQFGMSPLATQERPFGVSGKDVMVGLFDTSPFSITPNLLSQQTIQGKTLSVTHYATVSSQSTGITTTPNISGHGAYVAGIVNAVAPDTGLHLYRVLNDNGLGDEATLVQGLSDFISATAKGGGNYNPAIVNLSLGIFAPPTTTVQPLYAMLTGMHALSMTIVAAAGNDSLITQTYDAQIPAAYDFVIGVAAANTHAQRACYSNRGDIGAPGGDGDLSGGGCEPPTDIACPNDPLCLLTSWWNPTAPPTMTASAGTSFATPFVTGAAALVMQQRRDSGQTVAPEAVTKEIYDAALSGAPELGVGTLNLANLFYRQRVYLPVMGR